MDHKASCFLNKVRLLTLSWSVYFGLCRGEFPSIEGTKTGIISAAKRKLRRL